MLKKQNGTYQAMEILGDELQQADVGELIVAIIRKLVDVPEDVQVEFFTSAHMTVMQFDVGPGEVGKVLGKEHRTIDALHTLAFAMLGASGQRRKRCEIGVNSQRDPHSDPASS